MCIEVIIICTRRAAPNFLCARCYAPSITRSAASPVPAACCRQGTPIVDGPADGHVRHIRSKSSSWMTPYQVSASLTCMHHVHMVLVSQNLVIEGEARKSRVQTHPPHSRSGLPWISSLVKFIKGRKISDGRHVMKLVCKYSSSRAL